MMECVLQKTSNSLVLIDEIEKLIETALPLEVMNLFQNYSGSSESINGKECYLKYIDNDGDESSDLLIGMETFEQIIKNWRYRGYLIDFQKELELSDAYVEADKLFPIADMSDGGVYIAWGGKHDGKIYFVDNGDFGINLIYNSIEEFLKNIEEVEE